jgi:hypothetical protein
MNRFSRAEVLKLSILQVLSRSRKVSMRIEEVRGPLLFFDCVG